MEFIIGRDPQTSQLKVACGQQSIRLGNPGDVPMTVSRQHCLLTVDKYHYTIKNLKPQNVTFVNGMAIAQKSVKESDVITLGPEKYRIDLAAILKAVRQLAPKTADIRPLQALWEEHDQHSLDQVIAERKFNALRGATGLITMTAIILALTVGRNVWYIMLYCVAIFASFFFTIKAYRDSTNVPKKRKEQEKEFRSKYVCPNCGHHFTMPYDELSQYDVCPYCKAKFIR